ncbi:helix-turn-helix domain-containing protein [Mycobacterium kyogaense]|uniref:helix-turn-helix domain-containing protein n=1 Tax=Mycobacterium kyogaense TaxID=2212479 RepID=UPI002FFA237B
MTTLLREVIGDVLRRVRVEQGRTLREVSDTARVSLGYLSEVERGRKEASSELLSAICGALDVPLSRCCPRPATTWRSKKPAPGSTRRVSTPAPRSSSRRPSRRPSPWRSPDPHRGVARCTEPISWVPAMTGDPRR